ncbi:MAG: mechanosensitive ion channel family protein [Acidimicrobiia bacterium]
MSGTGSSVAAALAVSGPLGDLGHWARGEGLEIVLLLSGAVLLIRALKWMLHRSAAGFGVRDWWSRRATEVPVQPAAERPEVRRRQALTQAMGWLASALVSVMVGALVAVRVGIPLSTVVPPATVAGVAVGFGAQRVVADVLSGFFLLAERQLTVGDVVRISDPGSTTGVGGTVEEVTLRVTRLRTLKGEVVFIPNGEIRQLTNLTIEWARLVIDVPLRASEDVGAAITCLRQVGDDMAASPPWNDLFLDTPEVLGVEALDVGVVRVRVVARVRASDQWEAARELRLRITSGLARSGIVPVTPVVMPGQSE